MRKAMAVTGLGVLGASSAFAQVTLPVTGIDVGDYIELAIVGMGSVAAVAVGGYFAFLIIRKALAWGRRAL